MKKVALESNENAYLLAKDCSVSAALEQLSKSAEHYSLDAICHDAAVANTLS